MELLRDLFDTSVSVGTVHNRLQETAEQADEINQSQDLAGITVGLQDEIYQANKPVLVGVDAASTYCYLSSSRWITEMKTPGAGICWMSWSKASTQTTRLPMAAVG